MLVGRFFTPLRSVWRRRKVFLSTECFKPAGEIILQCSSSRGGKQKHYVGEPTAEWVSYECSSNKHGLPAPLAKAHPHMIPLDAN